jgi:hypothetical protein
MGPTAGRTSAQLQDMAEGLMNISLYDDDEILRKVTANLLTFGNVAGKQFDRAQLAAVNLSARLKTDLQSSTIMIGKALNDPVKGIAALSRAGIQFSADQKQMIMSMVAVGDTAGAQNIMLAELERQYGGAAQAARDANPSAAAILAWGKLQEVIGEKLIPVLTPLIVKLTDVLRAFDNLSPGMQNTILVGGAFLAVIGPIVTTLGALSAAFGVVLPLLGAIGPLFSSTGAIAATFWAVVAKGPAILSAIGTALRILVAASGPIGLLITALGLAYAAWKNWDKIEAIVRNLYNSVKSWLMGKLGAVLDWVGKKVEAVTGFFYDMWDKVVGNSYVPDMVDGIQAEMGRLDKVMVDPADKATSSTAQKFRDMAAYVKANPEAGRATIGTVLSVWDPERAKSVIGAQLGPIDTATVKNLIAEGFVPGTQPFKDAMREERTKVTFTTKDGAFYSGPPESIPPEIAQRIGGAPPADAQYGDLPRPASNAEFDKLKPGTVFIAPDGKLRTKPGGPASAPGGFRVGS